MAGNVGGLAGCGAMCQVRSDG